MSRFFTFAAAAVILAQTLESAAAGPRQPNVIVFLVDDMGWADSSPYGSRYYDTPNMHRLAKQGMRFTRAYSQPLCSPTRASLLTGKNAARHGITSAVGHRPPQERSLPESGPANQSLLYPASKTFLDPAEYTLAEAFRDAGYRTAHIGKWHLGLTAPHWPEQQGFDVAFHCHPDPGPPGGYFSPYGVMPPGGEPMQGGKRVVGTITDGPAGEYITDRLTDEAIRFVETSVGEAKDRPFFLNLWHYGVHGPWGHKESITAEMAGRTDPTGRQRNPVMASMLKSVDESLGRLLDTLDRLGIADDTIVLFTSDNGGNTHSNTAADRASKARGGAAAPTIASYEKWAGYEPPTNNAPLREGKGRLYEGGVRVPLIVRFPGRVKPGTTSDALVGCTDVYPTLLELSGVAARPSQALDGISYAGVLRGTADSARDSYVIWFPGRSHGASAYQGDWKLIRRDEPAPEEPGVTRQLFNLREDIGETKNLAAAMPGKVRELEALIDRLLVDTSAVVPKPNPVARVQPAKAAGRPPNVLFILTDDQPTKTVGCYPESPDWVRTPHIDRLAAGGVRFERAYLGSWCMPSRASLLTGKLQHGIESMRMAGPYPGSVYDPAVCRFIPAEFRRHGYHTAHIGKWHTGTDAGLGRDWDHQVVWNRPKLPENAGAYYEGQILAFNGSERRMDGYSTDVYTDLACDYIRGGARPAGAPWYLWLCYGAVHGPTTPARRHADAFAGREVEVPADIFGPRAGKPAYLDATQAWDRGPDGRPVMRRRDRSATNFDANQPGRDHAAWVRQVNECALAIDEGVGRLLAALEETGQLADTLVVFSSDQGFALGEHGLSMKLAPYDAAIASPLIVSRPGTVPEGVVRTRPVNSADIAVTLCGVAGIELPWPTHGRDFGVLLTDTAEDASPPMLLTNTGRSYGSDTDTLPVGDAMFAQSGVPWWVMLRDGRYKYIRTLVPGEVEEVYDLAADPEELENLAILEEHRPLLERLRAAAVSELRRTGAGFVAALPETGTEAKAEGKVRAGSPAKPARQRQAARKEPAAPVPTQANVKYGPHERHVLDFWKAESEAASPLAFVIHGGGWMGGDKDRVSRFVDVEKLLAARISVAAINYRLVPQAVAEGIEPPVKAPLHDAARALQFVRSKASEWNIDPARIGAAGGSAGACSSLWLAFHDDLADPQSADPVVRQSTRLRCAAVIGAQTTLDPAQMREWTPNSTYGGHAFGLTGDKGRKLAGFEHFLAERERILPWIAEYSPYALVTADDPPVYLSYAGPPAIGQPQKDPTHSCNFGLKLQERCTVVGVGCELAYPGAPNMQHATGTDFLIGMLPNPGAKKP